jgi:putative ABC transport system substrate-binding protein
MWSAGQRSTRSKVMTLLLVCLISVPVLAADVLIVKSKDMPLYDQAVEGFKEAFKGSIEAATLDSNENVSEIAAAVRAKTPRVILAVGSGAAFALKGEFSDVPIVYCMVMSSQQAKLKASNVVGVDMETPVDKQLQAFKEAIPNVKTLGVIYDPKQSSRFIESIRSAASGVGIKIEEYAIEERSQVLESLKNISTRCDGLWLIRDATVVTREFFEQALLLQAKKKLPVAAFSDEFVRKGAYCSFSASYRSQGRKAAHVVQSVLGGAKMADIGLQAPEGTLTINLTTAAMIELKVSRTLLEKPGVVTVGK